MTNPGIIQGRPIGAAELAQVRALLAGHPEWSRRRISEHLARLWNWRNAAGQLKDMAARPLLLKLEQRGWIELPARRQIPNNRMGHKPMAAPAIAGWRSQFRFRGSRRESSGVQLPTFAMKAPLRLFVTLGVVGVLCAVLWDPVTFHDVFFFRQWLEVRRVRKHCDAFALQHWATNLIALHGREDEPYYDRLSTNVPGDILALYSWPPGLLTGRDNVTIVWGRGYPFIRVDGSDYVLTNRLAARWIPGVDMIYSE